MAAHDSISGGTSAAVASSTSGFSVKSSIDIFVSGGSFEDEGSEYQDSDQGVQLPTLDSLTLDYLKNIYGVALFAKNYENIDYRKKSIIKDSGLVFENLLFYRLKRNKIFKTLPLAYFFVILANK